MTDDWILGFVWGIGTISDSRLYIRFHDWDFLEVIADTLHTEARPYHPTHGKTALRFYISHPFAQRLLALGWSGRFNHQRLYPIGQFNELEFVRGYCHTKATVDFPIRKSKKIMRLRIYGSLDIVRGIDTFISYHIDKSIKKPYLCRTNTGTCYCVTYQNQKYIYDILNLIGRRSAL
jgi:hypothetical protein